MLNSKQLLGGLLIVGVSIAFIQCKKNTPTPDNNGNNGGTTGSTTYTYTADIQPILTANCSCHVTGSTGPNLSTYANVKSRTGSVRSTIQLGGKMSKWINADNRAIVTNWIDGGAPQN